MICSACNPDMMLITHVVDDCLRKASIEVHIVQMLILHPGLCALRTAEVDHSMLLDRATAQKRLILARVQEAIEVAGHVLAVTGRFQYNTLWLGDVQVCKSSAAKCLQRRLRRKLASAWEEAAEPHQDESTRNESTYPADVWRHHPASWKQF